MFARNSQSPEICLSSLVNQDNIEIKLI